MPVELLVFRYSIDCSTLFQRVFLQMIILYFCQPVLALGGLLLSRVILKPKTQEAWGFFSTEYSSKHIIGIIALFIKHYGSFLCRLL